MSYRTVRDVMTQDVVTVGKDTPYRRIVALLAVRGVSAAPVLDPDDRVVGLVTEADLLHKIMLSSALRPAEYVPRHRHLASASRRGRAARDEAHRRTAAELIRR